MHPLLEPLDPEQRLVAETLRGPVRVLAGAGTGKTRAITHRIAYGVATGVYQPTEVLAVTFTTKAAGEMRERLRSLGAPGVQARTFHSAALRQLRFFWPKAMGGELPTLTESKLGMLASATSRLRVKADRATLRDLASEIEWAKVSNVSPDRYAALAPSRGRSVNGIDEELVSRIFAGYEDVKRNQGRMDMEDVLLLGAALLADDERVAAQVRRQYKFFTVDEFQDVSPIQSALLDLWLGGRDEICVVGDPAQTIYSFAGASPSYLREFTTRFPHAQAIDLVRNYRSTPEVVGVANRLLAGSPSQGVELRAQEASGSEVTYRAHPDEVAESSAVADDLAALKQQGLPWREMAVLFRINAQSEAFEDAFSAAGVPYVIRGAARFFDRPEVRSAVTLLRGTARGGAAADDPIEDVRGTLAGLGWTTEAPAGRGEARNRWESWQALVSQAEEFFAATDDSTDDECSAPSATSSTTWTDGPQSSMRRWPRASRSRRCTQPRDSSGTPCSCAASRKARCRSPTPVPRPRWRRSGGCSTSASPAPGDISTSRGLRPATPAGGPPASRRGSSTGFDPETFPSP